MKKTATLLNFVLLSSAFLVACSDLGAQETGFGSDAYPQAQVLTEIMERQAQKPKSEPSPLSIDHPFMKALSSAYVSNPELKARFKQQLALNESVPIAKSGFRPRVTLSSTARRTLTRPDNTRPPNGSNGNAISDRSISGAVAIEQSILSGGSTLADVKNAEESVAAGFEDVRSAEQNTLLSAVNAYLDLWARRAVVDLRRINEELLKKTLERAEARAEVGELTLTDVSQAKSSLADATANRISAEQEAFAAEATYIKVIGEAPASLEPPPPLVELMDMPEDLESFLTIAQRNNPDILRALATERAADHAIDVQKGSLLPSVDLSASASREFRNQDQRDNVPGNPNNRGNFGVNGTEASVTLRIPLFQSGSEWARLRQVHQTAVQRKVEARVSVNNLRESAKTIWSRWNAAKERIPQLIIRVKAAEISLQGARQESLVGERTLLDVLDTEKDLVAAQTDLVLAVRDYLSLGYSILATMGAFTVDKLSLPVERVDLRKHYEDVKDRWVGLGTIEE